MEKIQAIFLAINSPELQSAILPFKVIVILIDVIMIGFLIFVLVTTQWLHFMYLFDVNEFFTATPYGAKRLSKRWQQIQVGLQTGMETNYKLSVIDADAMFDEALQKLAIPGTTPEERLEQVSTAVTPNIEEVKQAHAIRNLVVRDPNYRLTGEEANRVIQVYRTTFENLDLI